MPEPDMSKAEVDITVTVTELTKAHLDLLSASSSSNTKRIGGHLLVVATSLAYASWLVGYRDGKDEKETQSE